MAKTWLRRNFRFGRRETPFAVTEKDAFVRLSQLLYVWAEPDKPKGLGSRSKADSSAQAKYLRHLKEAKSHAHTTFSLMKRDYGLSPELRLQSQRAALALDRLILDIETLVVVDCTRHERERRLFGDLAKILGKREARKAIRETLESAKRIRKLGRFLNHVGKWERRFSKAVPVLK